MGAIGVVLGAVLLCLVAWFTARELYWFYYWGPPKGIRSPPTRLPVFGHTLQMLRAGTDRSAETWVIAPLYN